MDAVRHREYNRFCGRQSGDDVMGPFIDLALVQLGESGMAGPNSGNRKLAGGTQWVKAPTAAPPSILTAAYGWIFAAPLLPRTPD